MKRNLLKKLSLKCNAGLLLGTAMLTFISASAQQANQYVFSQANASYTPITGGTVAAVNTVATTDPYPGPTDDVVTAAITIPFTFNFAGANYTSLRISSNGFVTFGTVAPGTTITAPISGTGLYNGAIAGFATDLAGLYTAGTLGEIRYETVGSAPNRTFVIQWSNFVRLNANSYAYQADNLNFQIRLHETTNAIDIVYGSMTVATYSRTVQVGLRGASALDYNNRISTTSWTATTAGTTAAAAVTSSATVKPAEGLTFTYTPPGPCTTPPVGGTAVASMPGGCPTVATSTMSLTNSQTGTGVTYQWQQSATGLPGSFTNVTGVGTGATYTATAITQTTYYRAIVTCSGIDAESTAVAVNVNPVAVPYATLPYTQNFESWVSRCNNNEVPGDNWRATPTTGNTSWRRNDQGFTSSAWSFPADEPLPYPNTSSQGSYSARFHTYGAATGTGILDLFIDLSAPGTKTLTFDYVNPTGTDKLDILLSNDGGTTWQTALLGTFTTSTGFSGKSVTFTATSATSVLRFRATTDYGADDLGIDNLKIEVTPSCPGVGFNATTAITSTGATVNFTGNSSATNYTFNYSPGGTPTTLTNDAPVVLTNLEPYTLYTVTVVTNCTGGETATATTTFRTAIGNNECSGAAILTPSPTPVPVTYTSSGATISTGLTSPCTTALAGDVWFSFVATEANHTITVVPTFDFDAVIDLRQGTCDGANIACRNEFANGGGASTETLNATGLNVGETYLLRVYSALANPSSGNFDISITGAAPASTGDFTKDTFTFYPNPVANELNVSASSTINNITIHNLLGQRLITKVGRNTSEVVDVSSLSAGTYMVNVQSENGMKQFKIVKN